MKRKLRRKHLLSCRSSPRKQLLGSLGVPLLEAFNTARRVDIPLRAREERVTLEANADTHVFARGSGLDDVAARAVDDGIDVFWMNLFFHDERLRK
jgi:hypothetical protein